MQISGGFPGGSDGKESASNAGDLGLIPGLGRCPGEGSGYPLQYSCLLNSMERGAWRATVHEVTKSWTRWSCTNTHTHTNKLTLVVYKLIKNLLARLAQNNKIRSSVIIIDIQQVCWSK